MQTGKDVDGDFPDDFVLGEEALAESLNASEVVQFSGCFFLLLASLYYETSYDLNSRNSLFKANIAFHLHPLLQQHNNPRKYLKFLKNLLSQGKFTDLFQHIQRLYPEILIGRV